jgi:hypothetical protein
MDGGRTSFGAVTGGRRTTVVVWLRCPQVVDLDVELLDKKIDQMMPELGFKTEDNDRLVASFSGGWQMRMCLGKLLLQVSGKGRVWEGLLGGSWLTVGSGAEG